MVPVIRVGRLQCDSYSRCSLKLRGTAYRPRTNCEYPASRYRFEGTNSAATQLANDSRDCDHVERAVVIFLIDKELLLSRHCTIMGQSLDPWHRSRGIGHLFIHEVHCPAQGLFESQMLQSVQFHELLYNSRTIQIISCKPDSSTSEPGSVFAQLH